MNTALVSGLIILVLLIIMLIAGVPIAVALGVSSVCAILPIMDLNVAVLTGCQRIFSAACLLDSPARLTHLKAIAAARDVGTFVCYAPRMTESAPFWPDEASLQETARAFFPQADVLLLKNSDLFPLFGSHELRTALFALFSGHVQLIFYSDSENIHLFTRSAGIQLFS